jgi:hypothetical protein
MERKEGRNPTKRFGDRHLNHLNSIHNFPG